MDTNQYKEMYISEALEHVGIMNESLLKLEENPLTREYIDAVFRSAHTIKGMAAMMEHNKTKELCKNIENVFDKFRKGEEKPSPDIISSILRCIDVLQQMIQSENENVDLKPYLQLLNHPENTKLNSNLDVFHNLAKSPTIRVKMTDLDSLVNLVEELVVTKISLEQIAKSETSEQTRKLVMTLDRLVTDLQYRSMKLRLVPMDLIFKRFPRLVRDLATSLKKDVKVNVDGGGLGLDRTVLDAITNSLLHILRNSVDHGLETPEERKATGKPLSGTIKLTAYRIKDKIAIRIDDDGRGIDIDALKSKAIEKKIISVEEAQKMTHDHVIDLIGTPGLSTVQTLTDISGRGVGMDVVKNQIQAIRGNMKIETRKGSGTSITLIIPVMPITEESFASTLNQKYVIPLSRMEIQRLCTILDSYIISKTSSAIATLLGENFVHNIRIIPDGVFKIKSIKQNPDEFKLCAVHLKGQGDAHIGILYTIKEKYAKKIAAKLLRQDSVIEMDDLGKSAVSEVGNVMSGSFINALSEGTGFKIDLSTPSFFHDNLTKILDTKTKEVFKPTSEIILADIELVGQETGIKIHMLVMQSTENARKVLEKTS